VPENYRFGFMATGIGSLPQVDAQAAVEVVLERLKEMPFWPQLPKRAPLEDMNLMYARALAPLVKPVPEFRSLAAFSGLSREEALAGFYERLFSGDLSDFGLNAEEAAGMFVFLERLAGLPATEIPWVKGQVTGPLTLGASVLGPDGKALLYDDEIAEALARGLGAAGAAQVGQLAPLGRKVLLFVDEPFLSGFGSAFTPITREKVIELLGYTFEEIRSRCQAVIGVHCCGNTDWGILVEAGAEVVNLDCFGYGENLLLYPEAVKRLFARGGAVAWGAVPTSEFKGTETAEGLWAGLQGLLQGLEAKGIDRATLAAQALVTPACGMGSMNEDQAIQILDLTQKVSELARKEYS
jgi:methionine synthase II (cobalamin-independent)